MELKDTVEFMQSSAYRERFLAEYWQLKIRYEKLKAFNTRIEAAVRYDEFEINSNPDWNYEKIEEPIHDCPSSVLREQQHIMGEYLHLLELRAEFEHIDLTQDYSA